MSHRAYSLLRLMAAGCVVCCSLAASRAVAQSNSLLSGRQLTRKDSWVFIEPEPVPQMAKHSYVTVIVDYRSQVISEVEQERKRKANIQAVLSDWLRLSGLDLKPADQADGDLTVAGSINARDKSDVDLETRDGMKFTITCEIVDIRPNGSLVLDGHRLVENNEEQWMLSLSGIVRPEDVLPNNTVLSATIAELHIDKKESGVIRDGYRRGWLLEIIDRYRPL